jgi:hypothetical protein
VEGSALNSRSLILTPLGYQLGSRSACTTRPAVVVVLEISSMTVHRSVRGRPRQSHREMNENSQCSILFHFEAPGG